MRIIAVTADAPILLALSMMADWDVTSTTDPAEAVGMAAGAAFALIDLGSTATGLGTAETLLQQGVAIPCLVIGDAEAPAGTPHRVLVRPFTFQDLAQAMSGLSGTQTIGSLIPDEPAPEGKVPRGRRRSERQRAGQAVASPDSTATETPAAGPRPERTPTLPHRPEDGPAEHTGTTHRLIGGRAARRASRAAGHPPGSGPPGYVRPAAAAAAATHAEIGTATPALSDVEAHVLERAPEWAAPGRTPPVLWDVRYADPAATRREMPGMARSEPAEPEPTALEPAPPEAEGTSVETIDIERRELAGRNGAEREAAEREAAEREAAEREAAEREAAEREAAEREAAEREAAEREAAEREAAEREAAEREAAEREAAEREAAEREAAEREAAEREAAEREAAEREAAEREAAEREAAEREAAEREAAEREAAEREAAEREAAEREAAEREAAEREAAEREAAEREQEGFADRVELQAYEVTEVAVTEVAVALVQPDVAEGAGPEMIPAAEPEAPETEVAQPEPARRELWDARSVEPDVVRRHATEPESAGVEATAAPVAPDNDYPTFAALLSELQASVDGASDAAEPSAAMTPASTTAPAAVGPASVAAAAPPGLAPSPHAVAPAPAAEPAGTAPRAAPPPAAGHGRTFLTAERRLRPRLRLGGRRLRHTRLAAELADSPFSRRARNAMSSPPDLEALLEEFPVLGEAGGMERAFLEEIVELFCPVTAALYTPEQDGDFGVTCGHGLTRNELRMKASAEQPLFRTMLAQREAVLISPLELAQGLVAGIGGARTDAIIAAPVVDAEGVVLAIAVVGRGAFAETDLDQLWARANEAAPGFAVARFVAGTRALEAEGASGDEDVLQASAAH